MTLREFFEKYKNIGIALSGGVDSVYLMYAAKKYGANVRAYFAKTELQPVFELRDAEKAAETLGVPLCVIKFSALEDESVIKNTCERCYFCKRAVMQIITATALSDGCEVVCDGTNASDDISDRPGFRALFELGVLSPLRLCGVTKEEIRNRAKEAGLAVWNKPSYACLATRIKTGEEITAETLGKIEKAEDFLFSLGFSDFRVRVHGNAARLELSVRDTERFRENKESVERELRKYFQYVLADLEARG